MAVIGQICSRQGQQHAGLTSANPGLNRVVAASLQTVSQVDDPSASESIQHPGNETGLRPHFPAQLLHLVSRRAQSLRNNRPLPQKPGTAPK